jgi:hypothetical protein
MYMLYTCVLCVLCVRISHLTPLMISFFWTMFLPMWSEVREARAAVLCVFGRPAGPARREDDAYERARARARAREREREREAHEKGGEGWRADQQEGSGGREGTKKVYTHTHSPPPYSILSLSFAPRPRQPERVQDALSRQTPDRCNAATPSGLS